LRTCDAAQLSFDLQGCHKAYAMLSVYITDITIFFFTTRPEGYEYVTCDAAQLSFDLQGCDKVYSMLSVYITDYYFYFIFAALL
jgi:hypothetical protein